MLPGQILICIDATCAAEICGRSRARFLGWVARSVADCLDTAFCLIARRALAPAEDPARLSRALRAACAAAALDVLAIYCTYCSTALLRAIKLL